MTHILVKSLLLSHAQYTQSSHHYHHDGSAENDDDQLGHLHDGDENNAYMLRPSLARALFISFSPAFVLSRPRKEDRCDDLEFSPFSL